MKRERLLTAGLALALAALSITINYVLFLPGEFPYPYDRSIEAGYASTAHFIRYHPNPWGWNPTQYCGLPTQFTYLPGLPYATAALLWLFPGIETVQMHRWLVTGMACLGPVSLFAFVLYFTRSRWWAAATALAYISFTPIYDFIRLTRIDGGVYALPWRLHILVKYGEGPHNVGLTLLPLAVMAAWATGAGRRFWQVLVAAVLMAAIALTNWIAAMALAFCCLLMMLAHLGTAHETGFRIRRLFAAAILAYLLACFWLTPTFIRTIVLNWPRDAYAYKLQSVQLLLLGALLAGVVLLRLLFLRFPRETYLCFLVLAAFTFSFIGFLKYPYRTDTIPESHRYFPETSLFLVLLAFEILRRIAGRRRRWVRALAIAASLAVAASCLFYARRHYINVTANLRPTPVPDRSDHRVIRFLTDRRPAGRVYVSGGTRFRLNAHSQIAQTGGVFESGLRNKVPLYFNYQLLTALGYNRDRIGEESAAHLRYMSVEYVVIHAPASSEAYRDIKEPLRFDGVLESVYRQKGDYIYRLPFGGYARLVRRQEMPARLPIAWDVVLLNPYVATLDDPTRPRLETRWLDGSRLEIRGAIPPDMLVSVPVSHDPGWSATQDGNPVAIERDITEFMLLHARTSSSARILLEYEAAPETKIAAAVSLAALLLSLAALWKARRRAAPA